jgi:TatD DNase family protein
MLHDATARGPLTMVLHSFTGTAAEAAEAVSLGCCLGFAGMVTLRSAADLRAVAAAVPVDRLLIETDSPYLAPVPHRGKTNQPAWVAWVAQQIADIKGLSIEAVAQATSDNFERLFSKSLDHASL